MLKVIAESHLISRPFTGRKEAPRLRMTTPRYRPQPVRIKPPEDDEDKPGVMLRIVSCSGESEDQSVFIPGAVGPGEVTIYSGCGSGNGDTPA